MTSNLCPANQLVQFELCGLRSIRFAIRLSLTTKALCAEVIQGDDALFEFFGAALIWPVTAVDEIWDLYCCSAAKEKGALAKGRDAIGLSLGLNANDRKLWRVYADFVARTWNLDSDFFMRVLVESLQAIDAFHGMDLGAHPNVASVAEIYALNAVETCILEFSHSCFQRQHFKEFLRCLPIPTIDSVWRHLAAMVGFSEPEVRLALSADGRLRVNGLIKLDGVPGQFNDFVALGPVAYSLFSEGANTSEGLMRQLLHPMQASQLCQEDFTHYATEIEWIVQCLKSAAQDRVPGINILLHGPTGTGKTELARVLVGAAGLQGYEVQSDLQGMDTSLEVGGRFTHLERTRRVLARSANSALIFKGVCDAAKHCVAELRDQLDATISPVIWIGDGSDALGDAVLRRFAFHLDMRQTPLSARKQIAEKMMAEFSVDPSTLDGVASDPDISPAQIKMAARFARLCGGGSQKAGGRIFVAALESSQRIKGAPLFSQMNVKNSSAWDVDALNLEASAPLPRILDALRRTGSASLAFHGIPGTGKTSLATHIAQILGKPLICKRVSDLLSRWIGETEKGIATMFREATSENAVLLLDEADSFLRDRGLARASWEVTQVNEMLQQMESFKGIFICATNLIEDVDAAALRRFTFKVRFLPLDDQRRRRMLARYALLDANADLPRPICDRLSALPGLAPGDFATVHRQEVMIDERFTLDAWMTELEREHLMRTPGFRRRAAFV